MSVKDHHSSSLGATQTHNNRSVMSEVFSPMGSLIQNALSDIPKIPDKFDKRKAEVLGVNCEKLLDTETDAVKSHNQTNNMSRMMLDRIKNYSILNHDVFRNEGVNYKKKVLKNYERYKQIVIKRVSVKDH